MAENTEQALEQRFLEETVEGYLDGRKAEHPEPSSNRSANYRRGFANGREDLANSPRLPAQVLRLLADQTIREDVAGATGIVPETWTRRPVERPQAAFDLAPIRVI